MVKPVHQFHVLPSLPPKLQRLQELAYNIWWSWNLDAVELFRRLDRELWETSGHNPVLMLGAVSQDKLQEAAQDEGYIAHLERVGRSFDGYLSQSFWFQRNHPDSGVGRIAYFSSEYGLTECLPIYSGGLGVLSGDHLKTSSDLGLPLAAVGLLYQVGYAVQYLNADGWQQESYPRNDFYNMPIWLQRREDNTPLMVEVAYPGRVVRAQIWRVQVGRVPLYLLDTNVPQNSADDRWITGQLYGGDTEMRIRQEIMLGIGGMRALHALKIEPTVCHMNEGHSAFLGLERIRDVMAATSVPFAVAREVTAAGNVFTTHTPVPAGIDLFPPYLMDRYFGEYWPSLGLSRDDFLALGRENRNNPNEPFSMAILALRLSGHANGVSKLHGEVARRMWQSIWPGLPVNEVPITHVTNAVHFKSFISSDMSGLYDRYLGPRWGDSPMDARIWEHAAAIPDEELWRTHERRRERLVAFARRRLGEQLAHRGGPPTEIRQAGEVLDPEALTIGFARRFATYKRANLILRDPDRLARILNNKDRPVQIIFAGKSHPADNTGKEFIRQIVHLARREEFRRRIVFVENYDTNTARYLVQGVDIWLNTPRRPNEASGTSGMKAAANGALNLSVLDGWWAEAYDITAGWAIGRGEDYQDQNYQDEVESNALYDILEKEVVPLFYQRGDDGLPRGWIQRMKSSLATLCPVFNGQRMLIDYLEQEYLPAAARYQTLQADDLRQARESARWKAQLAQSWPAIRVSEVQSTETAEYRVGRELEVRARVNLGGLTPPEVAVQLYYGKLSNDGDIVEGQVAPMQSAGTSGDGSYEFTGVVPCHASGRYGYTLRILPQDASGQVSYLPGYIIWAS
ncbi:MAG: glycosyltransferase family 1 protein [Chloroflexi bacterium]|nr:glycosyltransferase family 1 protein [Chloroflexota bacterium]